MTAETSAPATAIYGPILRLAAPACLSRFAVLGLTLITSWFVGQVGVAELAYLAIASSLQNSMLSPSYGLVAGFMPAMARAHAAGRRRERRRLMLMGMAFAAFVGCLIGLILLQGVDLLRALNQPDAIIEGGARCLTAFAWGMPAMTTVYAAMIMLEAMGRPRIPLLVMGFGNLLNLALLVWLIGGESGAAEAGAIATSLVRWGMAAAAAAGALYALAHAGGDASAEREGDSASFVALLRMGLPIALAACFETAAFTTLASFAGMLGAEALAGFQIAQNLYRVPFVVVAAIGIASGVECAAALGRGEPALVRRFGIGGMKIGAGLLVCVVATLALFPLQAAGIFTPDADFAASIRTAVLITAVLILFDGAQGHVNNLLRGLSDAAIPSITQFVAFWGVATPLGYVLAFHVGWGLNGVLIGLTVGLAVAAGMLVTRFFLHPAVRWS